MKFENLNLEKFEKIEKNELGKLVGGLMEGDTWTETDGGTGYKHVDDKLVSCTFSKDWKKGDEKKYICGEDMETPDSLLEKLSKKQKSNYYDDGFVFANPLYFYYTIVNIL